MDRVKRIWYLSPMRAAKVQASLRMCAVLPLPLLLAHTGSESGGTFRQKARSLAPLNGWACAVKICHDGMLEDTNSLDGAHIMFSWRTIEMYRLIIIEKLACLLHFNLQVPTHLHFSDETFRLSRHYFVIWAATWQNQQTDLCTQIRLRSAWVSALGICPVWSESSLCAQWVAKDPSFLCADSEDSDQTGLMPRLIWVFAGRIRNFVGFVMLRLICPDTSPAK